MTWKKYKNSLLHFEEKTRNQIFLLIWKSFVIGLVAAILGIIATLVFHFLSNSEHYILVIVRYSILSVAIVFGIYHLTKFSPKTESQNMAILAGLIIALTRAIVEIIFNCLVPFIDESIVIMDKLFQANSFLQYAIIELDLMINAVVFGFFVSIIYCMIFLKKNKF